MNDFPTKFKSSKGTELLATTKGTECNRLLERATRLEQTVGALTINGDISDQLLVKGSIEL